MGTCLHAIMFMCMFESDIVKSDCPMQNLKI